MFKKQQYFLTFFRVQIVIARATKARNIFFTDTIIE